MMMKRRIVSCISLFFIMAVLLAGCQLSDQVVDASGDQLSEAMAETDGSVSVQEAETEETVEPLPEPKQSTRIPLPEMPIDFKAWRDVNPDIFAWISIPDTPVDYPIFRSMEGDVDYYLDHSIDGKEGMPGSICTESIYNMEFRHDPVTVIFGHNMNNETMFGSLKHYAEPAYREAHPYVTIYTPTDVFTYKVVFAVTGDDRHIMYTYNSCKTDDDYADFLNAVCMDTVEPRWIDDDYDMNTKDQMVVLVTCSTEDTQRFWVGAVRVDE